MKYYVHVLRLFEIIRMVVYVVHSFDVFLKQYDYFDYLIKMQLIKFNK